MKRKILTVSAVVLILTAMAVIPAELFLHGYIRLNPSKEKYPVRGVDVSSYQGDIDWQVLSRQEIDFAFIKATEGSGFVDRYFEYNYTEALKTDLRVGAYHFFSYDSGGDTQAENFIKTVPKADNMLPPVIDVEFYGDKADNPPSREDVEKELKIMLNQLEEHYGLKPIIYATQKSYRMFLSGDYEEYDIWIRDTLFYPSLNDGRKWTFWQYTDKGELDGYNGEEQHIDMNVFNGTLEELKNYQNGKEVSE